MDYLLNYEEINSKWSQCEKELISKISDALSTAQIEFSSVYNNYVQSKYGMALNNMNLRFVEIFPRIVIKDGLKNDRGWYQNQVKIEQVAEAFRSVVNEYGFQFRGIEIQDNGKPLFVVQLSET